MDKHHNGEAAITIKFDDLPQALKYFRELSGKTQNDVRNIIDAKSAATISHYESGGRSVPLNALSKIFADFGYSIKFYLEPVE